MAYSGNPDLWACMFPDDLVPDIIDLVLDSWQECAAPAQDEREVPISRKLCHQMRRHKNRRRLPFAVHPEIDELHAETGQLLGRIDLRITHGYREEVYFALECKRLNVALNGRRSSLAGKYVDEGMMRFVTGAYAAGLDKSGMVGYVMDGKTESAISSVDKAMRQRRAKLQMGPADSLRQSSVKPNDPKVKQSKHRQRGSAFMIHHMFLPVQ